MAFVADVDFVGVGATVLLVVIIAFGPSVYV